MGEYSHLQQAYLLGGTKAASKSQLGYSLAVYLNFLKKLLLCIYLNFGYVGSFLQHVGLVTLRHVGS